MTDIEQMLARERTQALDRRKGWNGTAWTTLLLCALALCVVVWGLYA